MESKSNDTSKDSLKANSADETDHSQRSSKFLESLETAVQSLGKKSLKETVEVCFQGVKREFEKNPMSLIKEGFFLGAGLNGINSSHLKSGVTHLAKLLAFRALSEPGFVQKSKGE